MSHKCQNKGGTFFRNLLRNLIAIPAYFSYINMTVSISGVIYRGTEICCENRDVIALLTRDLAPLQICLYLQEIDTVDLRAEVRHEAACVHYFLPWS